MTCCISAISILFDFKKLQLGQSHRCDFAGMPLGSIRCDGVQGQLTELICICVQRPSIPPPSLCISGCLALLVSHIGHEWWSLHNVQRWTKYFYRCLDEPITATSASLNDAKTRGCVISRCVISHFWLWSIQDDHWSRMQSRPRWKKHKILILLSSTTSTPHSWTSLHQPLGLRKNSQKLL